MAEEIILTRFVGDTSNLDAAIADATKNMVGFDASVVKASQDTQKLDSTLGSSAAKFQQVSQSSKGAADAASNISKIGTAAENSAKGVGGLVTRIQTGFASAGNSIKGFTSRGISSVGGFFNSVRAGLPSLNGIGSAFQSAAGSVGGFAGTALSALGPVGIAVGALAGGLLKVISNTDAGATALDGLGRTGGIVFDKITGQVSGFFERLTEGNSAFGRFAQAIGEGAQFIVTKLTPIGFLLDQIGAIDAFKEAAEDGQRLAQVYDNIEDAQVSNIEANAKLERQVAQLNIQLRDRTKTDEERLKIGEQIDQLESQRIANELKVLKTITAAKRAEAALELRDNQQVSDATKRALAEAVAAEERAAQQSEQITERTANRVNAIEDAAAAKRAANAAKVLAAKEKAAQEEQALAQKVATAQAAVDKVVEDARDARIESGLSDTQKQLFAVEERYAKEIALAQKAFADIRALAGDNIEEQVRLSELEKSAILDIKASQAAEVEAIEVEQQKKADELRQADLDIVREATATKAELETDAINKRFDAAKEAAERSITAEEELTAALVEIEKARAEELATVQSEEAIKETERLKEQQERRVALLTGISDQVAGVVQGAADGSIKTAEEAGKALVGIAFDTIGAILAAEAVAIISGSVVDGVKKGGLIGGTAGLAAGLAFAALIKGLFAAAKATITANYEGDPYVGGDGSRPTWSGRDGYLRRLDKGERVVTSKTNRKHFDLFEAAEKDRVEEYVQKVYRTERITTVLDEAVNGIEREGAAMARHTNLFSQFRNGTITTFVENNYGPKVNAYMDSDEGRRTLSVTFPKYFDKGIVQSARETQKEQRTTNHLLGVLIDRMPKDQRTHPRYGR